MSSDAQLLRARRAAVAALGVLILWLAAAPPAAAKFEFVRQFGKEGGTGPGEFFTPWGIAVADPPDNFIFVLDTGNSPPKIHRFTRPDGGSPTIIAQGSGSGPGQFSSPEAIAVGDKVLYVGDFNNRIQIFDFNGKYLGEFGKGGFGDGEFAVPRGLAVDPFNGNLAVADSRNHRIQIVSPAGAFIRKWGRNGGDGTSGTGDGEFRTPTGVDFSQRDGRLYVVEEGNHRVQFFGQNGSFVNKWGSFGSAPGQFNSPDGIAVDGDDNVFVIEPAPGFRVQRFVDRELREVITGEGTPAYGFSGHDVAVDSEGYLYVLDGENGRVLVFRETPADTRPPKFRRFRRRLDTTQPALKNGGIVVPARPDEPALIDGAGSISFTGTATPGHVSASFRLRPASRFVLGDKLVRLKLRLRRAARGPIREALADGKRVTAKISLRATDISGNRSKAVKATVRVTRR